MTIERNLPFPDYLNHPAFGSSDLRNFARLPALCDWHRRNRTNGTDATALGTAAHCLILTPTLFADTYQVKPAGMTFASKVGKAWRDEKRAAGYQDDNLLSQAEMDQVDTIARAFEQKRIAAKSLRDAVATEASIFWKQDGLSCKGRPDWFTKTHVYDLKVSVHASKDIGTLRYRAWAEGWMHQAAHNRAGLRLNGYPDVAAARLVVIAPEGPSAVQTYCLQISEHTLDVIELEMESIRLGMVKCVETGIWPGMPDDWETIEIPASAYAADIDESMMADAVEVE